MDYKLVNHTACDANPIWKSPMLGIACDTVIPCKHFWSRSSCHRHQFATNATNTAMWAMQ